MERKYKKLEGLPKSSQEWAGSKDRYMCGSRNMNRETNEEVYKEWNKSRGKPGEFIEVMGPFQEAMSNWNGIYSILAFLTIVLIKVLITIGVIIYGVQEQGINIMQEDVYEKGLLGSTNQPSN